jgi:anti-sigma28 factor (negative regulator of flagellin synthesis)
VKINIHTDQYIAPAQVKTTARTPSVVSDLTTDSLSETSSGSTINAKLDSVAASRAARVSQLASLYASGRYTVNSAQLAQSLVSGALSK